MAARPGTDPSPRELDILTFVAAFRRRHGFSPTVRAIANQVQLSQGTVHGHLQGLCERELGTMMDSRTGIARNFRPSAAAEALVDRLAAANHVPEPKRTGRGKGGGRERRANAARTEAGKSGAGGGRAGARA